jgi:hypothetical protein
LGREGKAGAGDTIRTADGVADPQAPNRSVRGRETADARFVWGRWV